MSAIFRDMEYNPFYFQVYRIVFTFSDVETIYKHFVPTLY